MKYELHTCPQSPLGKVLEGCVRTRYWVITSFVLTTSVRQTKAHKGDRLKVAMKEPWVLWDKTSAVCSQESLSAWLKILWLEARSYSVHFSSF